MDMLVYTVRYSYCLRLSSNHIRTCTVLVRVLVRSATKVRVFVVFVPKLKSDVIILRTTDGLTKKSAVRVLVDDLMCLAIG